MEIAFESSDINTDLGLRVVVDTARMSWQPSPSGSVWRKPLFRHGGEHGPVTSIVRYAARGSFAPHSHPEGEEILVLDGLFSDEHGDYPAGTYLLNPHGSRHAPRSAEGCRLFVRLRQYPGPDRPRVVTDTTAMSWEPGLASGHRVKTLFCDPRYPDSMSLWRLEPGAHLPTRSCANGAEALVLEGELCDLHGTYRKGCWIRSPRGSELALSSNTGCIVYLRLGGPPGLEVA